MLEKVKERIQGIPVSCEALKFGAVCASVVSVPTALQLLVTDVRLVLQGPLASGGVEIFQHVFLVLLYMLLPFAFALLGTLKDSKLILFAAALFGTVIGAMKIICLDFMSGMPAFVVALCLMTVYVKEYCNAEE